MMPTYKRNDISSYFDLSSNIAAPPVAVVVPARNHPPLAQPQIWVGTVTAPASYSGSKRSEAFWSE